MTDSQFFCCRADDMDKYIAGVSLYSNQMEQKVHQLLAELEKERDSVRKMRDDAIHNEETFVMVASSLIEMSSLYRKFMRCRSVETWVHFEKNYGIQFWQNGLFMDSSFCHISSSFPHIKTVSKAHSSEIRITNRSGSPPLGRCPKKRRIFETSTFFQTRLIFSPSTIVLPLFLLAWT